MIKMDKQSGGSFIPKKTPGRPTAKVSSGRVIGIFGYFCYTVFFGALIAALGVFGLSYYIQLNLADRQDQLTGIRNDVDEVQIQELIGFDAHLRSAESIFASSFSVPYLLATLEDAVAEPVVFYLLNLTRAEGRLSLEGFAFAESFDIALFQRQVTREIPYATVAGIRETELTADTGSVLRQFVSDDEGGSSARVDLERFIADMDGEQIVTFVLELDVPIDNLPFSLDFYDANVAPSVTQSDLVSGEAVDFFADESVFMQDDDGSSPDTAELDLQDDELFSEDLSQ